MTHCSIHILNLNGDKVINALHIIVSGIYAIQGTIVIYPPVRLAWLVLEQQFIFSSVGLSIKDKAMNVARSMPQGTHFNAKVGYVGIKKEAYGGAYVTLT